MLMMIIIIVTVTVELLKMAHTAQLAQQAGAAVNIQYLTVDAGKANK